MTGPIPYQRLPDPGQLASVHQSILTDADGRSYRAIDVAMFEGLTIRVLPDRGLDIAECRYRGVPLHWAGWAREAAPAMDLLGQNWERHFFGGLITTCGLANVGAPSEGHGQHGRYNHLAATDITIDRAQQPDRMTVSITGILYETTLDGGLFHNRRTIKVHTGSGTLSLRDEVTNLADKAAPAPILYHINFGWPMVAEDCRVEVAGSKAVASVFGEPSQLPGGWQMPGYEMGDIQPVTIEHEIESDQAEGRARLISPQARSGGFSNLGSRGAAKISAMDQYPPGQWRYGFRASELQHKRAGA